MARKAPTQKRSRETVERILESATRVFSQRGWADATTAEVAAEAGVSPGSLYQYFSGKDELLAALAERTAARFAERVEPELRAALALEPGRPLARAIIDAGLSALESEADVIAALAEGLASGQQSEAMAGIRVRFEDVAHLGVVALRPAATPVERSNAVWMIGAVTQAMLGGYVTERPAVPRERIVDETTDLVLGIVERLPDGAAQTTSP